MPNRGPFGVLLADLRRQKHFTQSSLAAHCRDIDKRVSKTLIANLESGATPWTGVTKAAALADALGLQGAERETFMVLSQGERPGYGSRHLAESLGQMLPIPLTPFVGHRTARATVRTFVREGETPLLLVHGLSGIGTTRLVEQAVADVRQRAPLVLHGSVPHPVARRPYDPIGDALDRHMRRTPRRRLREEVGMSAGLARILPQWLEREVDIPLAFLEAEASGGEEARGMLIADLVRYLDTIGASRGTMLVLDNLHWAGPDAVALLVSLVEAVAVSTTHRTRIVGIYHDEGLHDNAMLRDALLGLAFEGFSRDVPLGPLTLAESDKVLQAWTKDIDGLDRRLFAQVLQKAARIPLRLVVYGPALVAGMLEEIPPDEWSVARVLGRRMRDVDNVQTDVLDALAVYGWPAPPSVVTALVDHTDDEVARALATLVGVGLLAEGDGDYRFAHDIIRHVSLVTIASIRRLALHVRCARVVTALANPALADLRAYHAHEAPPNGVLRETISRDDRMRAIDAARIRADDMFAVESGGEYARHLFDWREAYGEGHLVDINDYVNPP